jgi:hypothetical protein
VETKGYSGKLFANGSTTYAGQINQPAGANPGPKWTQLTCFAGTLKCLLLLLSSLADRNFLCPGGSLDGFCPDLLDYLLAVARSLVS